MFLVTGNETRALSHLLDLERKEDPKMKVNVLTISAITIALAAPAGWISAKAYAAPTPQPAAGLFQDRRWDEPPEELREAQKKGFHEGVEAARHDFERRNHKDADDHEAYRHPRVERSLRDDYREGFRRGYEAASHHMMDEHHDHDHD
jgi:hypothetical protein